MTFCTNMVYGAFQDSGFVHSVSISRGRAQGGKCARDLWIMFQGVKLNLRRRLQMEMSTFVLFYNQWKLYHTNTVNGQFSRQLLGVRFQPLI